MKRPEANEYAPFYAHYVSLVEETDIVSALQKQADDLQELFLQIPEEKGVYAYAEGKWTIKELLGHLIDGERIFAYRALRIGRGDKTPLEGYDQDPYVENGDFNRTSLADLLTEFLLLRNSNVLFFRNLSESKRDNFGVANNNPVSVRAIAYIMVGHVRHHVKVLKERYL